MYQTFIQHDTSQLWALVKELFHEHSRESWLQLAELGRWYISKQISVWRLGSQCLKQARLASSEGFSIWLADVIVSPSSHGSSLCAWLCPNLLSYKELEPFLMTLYNLNYLFIDPVCKYNHILKCWGLRLHIWIFRQHNAAHNTPISIPQVHLFSHASPTYLHH